MFGTKLDKTRLSFSHEFVGDEREQRLKQVAAEHVIRLSQICAPAVQPADRAVKAAEVAEEAKKAATAICWRTWFGFPPSTARSSSFFLAHKSEMSTVAIEKPSSPPPPDRPADSVGPHVRGETTTIKMQKRDADQKVGIELGYSKDGRWLVIAAVNPGTLAAIFSELKPGAKL